MRLKKFLASVTMIIGFLLLPLMACAQLGPPITVGPTPVFIYSPGRATSVTVVQTAGTSAAYVIYSVNRAVLANKAAASVYTFVPSPPATNFTLGEPVGMISISTGTATFRATAITSFASGIVTHITGPLTAGAVILGNGGGDVIAGVPAKGVLLGTTVYTDQINTYGAFRQNFASALLTLPTSAGFTTSSISNIGIDSITQNLHVFSTGIDALALAGASPLFGGRCMQSSGTGGLVQEIAGPCGSIVTVPALNTAQPAVLDCTAFAGADMGAKINACIAALPASGGIANARNFTSPQTISTAIVDNKAAVIQTCGISIILTAPITLSATQAAWQGCINQSTIITQQFAGTGITLSGLDNSLSWINYVCNSSSFSCLDILLNSALRPILANIYIENWVTGGLISTNSTQATFSNVRINEATATTGAPLTLTNGSGIIDNMYLASIGTHDAVDASGQWNISNSNIFSSGTTRIGINHTGGQLILANNTNIQGGTTFPALSSVGAALLNAFGNTFTSQPNSDVVLIGGNNINFSDNKINLQTNSSSGHAGIHMQGDSISMLVQNNKIYITTLIVASANYCIWMDVGSVVHFMQHQVTGNTCSSNSGVKTQDFGIFFDNASNNTGASGIVIANTGCTDINAFQCITRSTSTIGSVFFSNNTSNVGQPMAIPGGPDVIKNQSFTFIQLPTAGNGTIIYCTDCTTLTPVTGGGTGTDVARINNVWVPWANAGGLLGSSSGLVCATNITPVTVSANVTTDQNLMVCAIPANYLNNVGKTLQVNLKGLYSTPAASAATINVKLKLCTVSGCGSGIVLNLISITSSANPGSVTNNTFLLQSDVVSNGAGASASFESSGQFTIDLGALTTSPDSVFADTNTALVGVTDTTGALFLQSTVAFSVANASNSATARLQIVEAF